MLQTVFKNSMRVCTKPTVQLTGDGQSIARLPALRFLPSAFVSLYGVGVGDSVPDGDSAADGEASVLAFSWLRAFRERTEAVVAVVEVPLFLLLRAGNDKRDAD
jgi:hypothetical protein